MNKILIIVFLLISMLVIGCESQLDKKMNINQKEGFATVTIDGCEYIIVEGNVEYSITHKGNCKNPIHKQENK